MYCFSSKEKVKILVSKSSNVDQIIGFLYELYNEKIITLATLNKLLHKAVISMNELEDKRIKDFTIENLYYDENGINILEEYKKSLQEKINTILLESYYDVCLKIDYHEEEQAFINTQLDNLTIIMLMMYKNVVENQDNDDLTDIILIMQFLFKYNKDDKLINKIISECSNENFKSVESLFDELKSKNYEILKQKDKFNSALKLILKKDKASLTEILKIINGPDLPTGGEIILDSYEK